MNKLFSISLLVLALLLSLSTHALSPAGQRNIDLLTNGGPISIRNAAKSIYNTGERDQQVLDVLAEVLLESYQKPPSRDQVDAMSWASKALGRSGNARYRDTLEEVASNGSHRKLRKHAKKSLRHLDKGTVEQYTKGSASLAAASENSAEEPSKPAATVASTKSSTKEPITIIRPGMGMAEVYDLAGEPTARISHETGKRWIPFNFKGADNVRTIALYKGQGRIIFANESNYSSGWKVIDIQLNEEESGYP
ncbi:MAG: hypothetical protein JKY90_01660 [Gammaproteobacteria bacterium]|nr:hypothetical protein [Gammaproteobacteria bacterium]